jgi:hypothetical protein
LPVEPNEDHAAAWLLFQKDVNERLPDLRTDERRLELDVANHAVCFKDKIVAAVVHLRLQYLKTPVAP